MTDYQKGKIYKMESPSGLTYVGSTCEPTLAHRLAKHKSEYISWKYVKKHYLTSFRLFQEDRDNVKIYLLEAYPCNSRDELHAREGFYIKQMECVNRVVPGRTAQEYYEDNRDKINAKKKKYREDNREKINAKNRAYRARKRAERECKLYTDVFDGLQAMKTAREARFNLM